MSAGPLSREALRWVMHQFIIQGSLLLPWCGVVGGISFAIRRLAAGPRSWVDDARPAHLTVTIILWYIFLYEPKIQNYLFF
jgi:hypothetical protein